MAISFTRPDPASPASVSAAQFPTSRRGYDQAEVRDFLRMVAAEQARLQERERSLERELKSLQEARAATPETIDEDTATRLLGEEAARVLQTAREAAAQIRVRAEEAAARLLRDATDEAQRLREEAELEAARRRQDATADSEAELNMAKQQGRDMVNEARAYRERVLSELARRREVARQQIEQLIHGRDRLLQAFERARLAAVDVMAELTPLGEPTEYVNLQPTTGPVPMMVPATGGTSDLSNLVRDAGGSATAATRDEPTELVAVVSDATAALPRELRIVDDVPDEVPDQGDPEHDVPDVAAGDLDDTLVDEPTPDPASIADVVPDAEALEEAQESSDALVDDRPDAEVFSLFRNDHARSTDDEHPVHDLRSAPDDEAQDLDAPVEETAGVDSTDQPDPEPDLGAEPAGPASTDAPDAGDPTVPPPKPVGATVEDLFARLRAARTEDVARAAEIDDAPTDGSSALTIDAEPSPSHVASSEVATTAEPTVVEPEAVEASPIEPDTAPIDAILVPLIVSAARKVKRVLADEQNDLLDTLRRKEPIRSLDVLLPWEADQSARYVAAVEGDLLAAAAAGAQGGENGRNPAIIRPSIDAVTNEIVAPLRDRLIRCIDRADGDNAELSSQVRSLYREWKTQRIDEHVEDIVRLAYDRGALTIASR